MLASVLKSRKIQEGDSNSVKYSTLVYKKKKKKDRKYTHLVTKKSW